MEVQPNSYSGRCSGTALRAAATAAIVALVTTAASEANAGAATSLPHGHPQTAQTLSGWKLPALIAAVIVVVLLSYAAFRGSRRTVPRRRRHLPGALLLLLAPIFRHDDQRDAWILRMIGGNVGPVLRPHGYRPVVPDEPAAAEDPVTPVTPLPMRVKTNAMHDTPDPFPPTAAAIHRDRRDRPAARQDRWQRTGAPGPPQPPDHNPKVGEQHRP